MQWLIDIWVSLGQSGRQGHRAHTEIGEANVLVPVHWPLRWLRMCTLVLQVEGSRFSTVVTSSAGYPLDKTYYQTVKGMVTCLGILEPGEHHSNDGGLRVATGYFHPVRLKACFGCRPWQEVM